MKLERFQKRLNRWGIALLIWMAYIQVIQVFLVMKLTGTWEWSWLWITAPLWLPWFAFLVIGMLLGLVALIIGMIRQGRSREVIESFPGVDEERGIPPDETVN